MLKTRRRPFLRTGGAGFLACVVYGDHAVQGAVLILLVLLLVLKLLLVPFF